MGAGRNIPKKSATGAFHKAADEIVRDTKEKTDALKNARAKDSAEKQHSRFVEMAREVGADESSESFDKAFKQVVKK